MTAEESLASAEPAATPNPTAGMTTKVVKGSLWTLIGQIAPLAVSFFATPFVIRLLGSEAYGVFVLVGLIPGYFGFADFGMGMASTKFGSEAYGNRRFEREARIIRTAALIALTVSLPIAVFLFGFSGWVTSLFNVPENLISSASLALKLASATFVINFLNSIFNTPQLSRLRMDLNTTVAAVPRMLGVLATPIVLYLGGGIVAAVLVLLIASALTLAGHFLVSRRLLPELVGLSIDREAVRPLLKFGGALVFASIASVVLVNVEKLILVKLTSVETLAHYSVAYTFANMMTIFTLAMAQSLVPAFSQLVKPEKLPQLTSLYSRSLKINIFGLLPCLLILAIIAKPFFTLWAGEEFGRESPTPFYLLLVGLFFNLNAYVPWALLLSFGRTDIFAKNYWLQILPYVGLAILLTYNYGAAGAAAAWSLRVVGDSFIIVFFAKRVSGVNVDYSSYALKFLLGILILAPPLVLMIFVGSFSVWLILSVPICIAAYALLLWKRVFDTDERRWVASRVETIHNKILQFV